MGVRLLSRWAWGPAPAGIDPEKRPARDALAVSADAIFLERAQ